MKNIVISAADCKKGAKFLFRKDPAEQGHVDIDYEQWLPEGVFICAVSATAVDRRTGADATGDVIDATSIEQNDDLEDVIARVSIRDGLVGHSYCVTVTVDLDDGFSIDVRCFEFSVKSCGA